MKILLLIFLFLQYFVTGQNGAMNNQNSFLFTGYIPSLYNGPNECCKHNANWDDGFTLMCQTCAFDVINKEREGLTYKYLKNNETLYEITCTKTSYNKVQCRGKNNENGGRPYYQSTCDNSCIPNLKFCTNYQTCHNNKILVNNNEILICSGNDNFICNNTVINCKNKDCNIITEGNGENILNNVFIDATSLDENSKLEINCKANGANDCKNIEIICPKKENTVCKCIGCDYSTTKLHCYHGSGVKCSGGSIVEYWDANNIWCKGSILGNAICNDVNETLMQCRGYGNYYNNLFPPNNKCVASREVMFHNGQKYERILVGSCGKMVNNSFVYSLPKCFNYLSKPNDIPTIQELLTKIITYNNTIYNTSKCFEDPYMCGEMPCKYCNDVGCCTSDPTGHHCKTKNPYAKDCPEPKPCNKDEDDTNDEFNFFNLKFKQIYVVYTSLGLAGLCTFACSFYVAWHCYLRDKIKDILNDYLCCGLGEYILCICDFIGCCKDAEEEEQQQPVRRIRRQITRQMTNNQSLGRRQQDSPTHQTVVEMSNIKSSTDSPGTPRRRIRTAFI